MKTLKCVSKYPDDNTAAAELSFLYFPPFYARVILMTSLNDIMIVCSIILVGKPLCMCRQSTNSCLHTHWHPCQLTVLTESTKCHRFVSKPIFMPVTYIYIYIYVCVCMCVCVTVQAFENYYLSYMLKCASRGTLRWGHLGCYN